MDCALDVSIDRLCAEQIGCVTGNGELGSFGDDEAEGLRARNRL
jgi:hypothetical protein